MENEILQAIKGLQEQMVNMQGQMVDMQGQMASMEGRLDAKISAVDAKVDAVDAKIDRVKDELRDDMHIQLRQVNNRLGDLDAKIDGIQESINISNVDIGTTITKVIEPIVYDINEIKADVFSLKVGNAQNALEITRLQKAK